VVAAGGRGERARTATLKQFRELGARPLISWSLDALEEAGCDPLIVVVPPDELDAARAIVDRPDVVLAEGGETRQESVRSGLTHAKTELVTVHDAARPFLTPALVLRTVAMLGERDVDGVVVGMPLDETVKRIDDDLIIETMDRSDLWRVQTPQTFVTAALVDAHERAAADGFKATDDAQVVERYGRGVALLRGARDNIKLTFPEDFVIAEAMLAPELREERGSGARGQPFGDGR
jgi:2-C-methyl-D-erythritol 4-phosphate cytidylyltransferase